LRKLLIFGMGYTGARLADAARADGFEVAGTRRSGPLTLATASDPLAAATHVLSSVPPEGERDPVLDAFGDRLAGKWRGYLSSTGVYGDTGGAWVDETAPVGGGRRTARAAADLAWQAAGAHVFRLPGIYGPGRSALDRVREGKATRIDAPGQVFSRVHVDDIVQVVLAAMDVAAPGVWNVADALPAPGRAVTEHACDLLGAAYPPLEQPDSAALSPMARAFYSENRRVAAGRIARDLGVRLRYPTYREGLLACLKEMP
jgi:nucleoside-diphosphate-sugar epimerase